MDVEPVSWMVDEWFGHEGGFDSLGDCDVFDDGAQAHQVVCHGEGIGDPEVYFVLAGTCFMVGEFYGDAEVFEVAYCLGAEALCEWARYVIEVGAVIDGDGFSVSIGFWAGRDKIRLLGGRGM